MSIKKIKPFFQKGKQFIFYRQHPEAALRYLPLVKILKELKLDNERILEVGSGSYGITPYLKKPIVGVDTSFSEPEYPLLKQVSGSAVNLPFSNNEFAVVILSDVLEHLPQKFRSPAINEAIRVSNQVVLVSGPFGKKAADQDKRLAEYSQQKTGQLHPFFIEHLKFGLPEVEDIIKIAQQNKKVAEVKIVGHFFNLKWRERLMKIFVTNKKLQYYFYLKGLMPSVPFLLRQNQQPTYRQLILISLKK